MLELSSYVCYSTYLYDLNSLKKRSSKTPLMLNWISTPCFYFSTVLITGYGDRRDIFLRIFVCLWPVTFQWQITGQFSFVPSIQYAKNSRLVTMGKDNAVSHVWLGRRRRLAAADWAASVVWHCPMVWLVTPYKYHFDFIQFSIFVYEYKKKNLIITYIPSVSNVSRIYSCTAVLVTTECIDAEQCVRAGGLLKSYCSKGEKEIVGGCSDDFCCCAPVDGKSCILVFPYCSMHKFFSAFICEVKVNFLDGERYKKKYITSLLTRIK